MKIVCLLERDGGSEVVLGKTKYNFKPDAEGNHVCEVANEKHQATLLGIKEAYYEQGHKPEEVEEELEQDDVLDPEEMDNTALNAWAKERGFNSKNKQSIVDYVRETYEIELEFDDSVNCATLIREAVKLDLEEAEQEEA